MSHRNWLVQVMIEPVLRAALSVLLLTVPGYCDQHRAGRLGVDSESPRQFVAVHIGQPDVEQAYIGVLLQRALKCTMRSMLDDYLMTA